MPLRAGTTPLKFAPDYESWLIEAMKHGDNDAFWADMGSSVIDHLAQYQDVPSMHFTGWYDSWTAQVANLNYVELSKSKKQPQRLIVGPWTHAGQGTSFSGIAEFGPAAALNMNEVRLRWFDRWLKGLDNGVEGDTPVRLFVMGSGEPYKTKEGRLFVGGVWRDEREWPLSRALNTDYFLHADGTLSTKTPADAAPTRYDFDPRRPVPTIGGNVSSEGVLMLRGAQDQRCTADNWLCSDTLPLSARPDVVVFQTPPLERDTEVTGRLVVKLWASSDGPDTDFTAKLIDVYPPSADYPAGVDLNVGDSIVRARYRDSLKTARPLEAGKALRVHDRDVSDLAGVPARASHPRRHLEQQLPAVRRESEHRRAAQRTAPLTRGGEFHLPRCRSIPRASCFPSSPRSVFRGVDRPGPAESQGLDQGVTFEPLPAS